MDKNDLFKAIGNIDDSFVTESEKPKIKHFSFQKITAVAAAIAVVVCSCIVLAGRDKKIELSKGSVNTIVRKIDENPFKSQSASFSFANSLIELSLDEIFSKYCSAIFKGTVTDAQNIEIIQNLGERIFPEYNAIATVKVEKVYKGDLKEGDTVKILLGCAVDVDGYWVEDTEVVSNMSEGVTGIFMPKLCDENSYREEGNSKLMYADLAEYYFMDGVRFAFLESASGLIYDEWTYGKKLEDAKTLDDVEVFITENLS